MKSTVQVFNESTENFSEALLMLAMSNEVQSPVSIRTAHEVQEIIFDMFSPITMSEIQQQSGAVHLNCGEVTVSGVSCILGALGDITGYDTFVDIGSGIGNVLAQVALETSARFCFGIECQSKVVQVAKRIILRSSRQYPELCKLYMTAEDIQAPKWHTHFHLLASTILYSNNLVFESAANFQLEQFLSAPNHTIRYRIKEILPQAS